MPSVDIELLITVDEFVKRYRVPNAVVLVRSSDGRRVQFPASALQRFVTRSGISGRFRIGFDDKGKLVGVERVSEIGG